MVQSPMGHMARSEWAQSGFRSIKELIVLVLSTLFHPHPHVGYHLCRKDIPTIFQELVNVSV